MEFFANNRLLGESVTPPYLMTYHGVPAGRYEFTAVATDTAGRQGYSPPVNCDVPSNSLSVEMVRPVGGTRADTATPVLRPPPRATRACRWTK